MRVVFPAPLGPICPVNAPAPHSQRHSGQGFQTLGPDAYIASDQVQDARWHLTETLACQEKSIT
jgi:hypothetical protein